MMAVRKLQKHLPQFKLFKLSESSDDAENQAMAAEEKNDPAGNGDKLGKLTLAKV
jgi:hypothetical protein